MLKAVPEILRSLPLEQISKLETRFPIEKLWTHEKAYLDKLTTEIEREGMTEPITIRVREDGSQIVWDGMHRLAVAQKLGIENIPVKFIGDIAKLPETAEVSFHLPPNAAIRTSERWDEMVRHLGYEPVTVSEETRFLIQNSIPTDVQLIEESQERLEKVKVVPDTELTPEQLASLKLARAITGEVTGVKAALIPPASARVRTAGLYSRKTRGIFIGKDQLNKGQKTTTTIIHELAHHTSGAEDGEEAHNSEMARVAGEVTHSFAQDHFAQELSNPNFQW